MKEPLSKEEQNAINALKRLAKRWPKSLWLWSADGSLHIMKYSWSEKGDGMRSDFSSDSRDPNGMVDTIKDIDNDGGDW